MDCLDLFMSSVGSVNIELLTIEPGDRRERVRHEELNVVH